MTETSLALALSTLTFLMAVIWGGPLIRILRYLKIGKIIRIEGPSSHFSKMGTPTMGGWMIILPVIMVTVLLNATLLIGLDVFGRAIVFPLISLVGYGLLGAIDDWEGVRGKRRGLGMRARTKFLIQIVFALFLALSLKYLLDVPETYWPGWDEPISIGVFYLPVATFIIVGASNAVNFTDGLDGLAGLISATAFVAYGAIALQQGQVYIARFCFTIVGALFGFLWWNVHPAEMIMGDTGSQALGATIAVISLMTGQWLLLPIILIIPVSEILSVILQVAYFRITHGRRLFKMAPLHHHFELLGWSETQVVQRFWLIGLLFGMLGIAVGLV